MANVKRIDIRGSLPFDAGASEALEKSKELLAMLGQMQLPSMGTRIQWGRETMVPNRYGGKTAFYDFALGGDEAVSWEYLDLFKELVEAVGGSVKSDRTRDIEA